MSGTFQTLLKLRLAFAQDSNRGWYAAPAELWIRSARSQNVEILLFLFSRKGKDFRMLKNQSRIGIFSGNALKIIAAISMLLDHMGVLLFPNLMILRYLGRVALPIFAFMIAEGCRYTRRKGRYFLLVFLLGFGCQAAYYVVSQSLYLNILLSFSLSILIIFALQTAKKAWFAPSLPFFKRALQTLPFLAMLSTAVLLNLFFTFDYGIWGMLLPVFAALLHPAGEDTPKAVRRLDQNLFHVLCLTVGMMALIAVNQSRQWYSLLALPFLLLYSGKRGKASMKYFFYIFYPLHLVILEGIRLLISMINA